MRRFTAYWRLTTQLRLQLTGSKRLPDSLTGVVLESWPCLRMMDVLQLSSAPKRHALPHFTGKTTFGPSVKRRSESSKRSSMCSVASKCLRIWEPTLSSVFTSTWRAKTLSEGRKSIKKAILRLMASISSLRATLRWHRLLIARSLKQRIGQQNEHSYAPISPMKVACETLSSPSLAVKSCLLSLLATRYIQPLKGQAM